MKWYSPSCLQTPLLSDPDFWWQRGEIQYSKIQSLDIMPYYRVFCSLVSRQQLYGREKLSKWQWLKGGGSLPAALLDPLFTIGAVSPLLLLPNCISQQVKSLHQKKHFLNLFVVLVCNSTCSNSRQHPLLTDCLCWRQRKQHQPYFKLPQLTWKLGSLPSFHVIAKDAVSVLCLYIFASLSFSCLANLVALLQWGASGHVMHVFPWDTLHLPLIITQLLIIMPQIIQLG